LYTIQQAKLLYEEGIKSKNVVSELIAIGIYLRDFVGVKPKQRKEMLYEYAIKNNPEFSIVRDWKIVDIAFKRSNNKKNVLFRENNVDIMQSELDYINQQNISLTCKTLLFTLIARYKKTLLICEDKNIQKVSKKINLRNKLLDLSKSCSVYKTQKAFLADLKLLEDMGYLQNVNFIYLFMPFLDQIPIVENDNVACTIKDGNTIGLYYDYCMGSGLIKFCLDCGKMYRGNSVQKRCKNCAKINRRQKQNEWFLKYYKENLSAEAQKTNFKKP